MKKFLAVILSLMLCFVFCSCSDSSSPNSSNNESKPFNPNENILQEDVLEESILSENLLKELTTKEIYLRELLYVENEVTELLIKEERITEVLLCKTIYVPQENIEDFSDNSQTAQLFGEGVNISSLLTKVAIGTGVIITLSVLSVAGISGPIGSIVASAAPAAIKGAAIGMGSGTLVGGLIGATDAIDETGRTSAALGLASALVGLILTTVSFIAAIPSGGGTAITASVGIKLFLAGMSLAGAVAGASYAGYNAVKTYTSTDATKIDWDNVDWNKVGESAARQSIQGAANGYMWGSIIGAISGGAEGLDNYEKYGAPYSQRSARIARTPADDSRGHWTGERGESTYVLNEPKTCANGKVISEVSYKNGIPDFSHYAEAKVNIPNMTNKRYGTYSNFSQADKQLASYWSKIKFNGKKTWSAQDVAKYRESHGLTWHEMNNMKTMQLVPTEVNATWGHLGGVGEYNAMINAQGGADFD